MASAREEVASAAADAEAAGPAVKRAKRATAVPFSERKARLLERDGSRAASAAGLGPLSAEEAALERGVLQPAKEAAAIDPAKNFLDHKKDYDASGLLKLLQRMPKGAVLHTHGIASCDFQVLVGLLQKDDRIHVWQGGSKEGDGAPTEGALRVFLPGSAEPVEGWVPASHLAAEKLYGYLTLPPGLPSVEACWEVFGKLWDRVAGVGNFLPLCMGRGGWLWNILAQWRALGIMYVEIGDTLFVPWTDGEGRALTDAEAVRAFGETVSQFCAAHPDFVGARLRLTALKFQTEEEIRECFRRAVSMKEQAPDFVAGFDMAGPEDKFKPIASYAAVLEEERATAAARGVHLPLLLHAGETNMPESTQVLDAVALGCERIGHGFALARHPAALEEVLSSGASLECCPISNQVLGYCPDIANHAALGLFRAGVSMSLSPDDPGMWHYSDVSYDFAAATKAWNLGLLELKALAKNSLTTSTLRGQQLELALQAWELQWEVWVEKELRAIGGPKKVQEES